MDFEWDERTAASNLKKHGVSFQEAVTAVMDPLAISRRDALDDERAVIVGMSNKSRLLVTVVLEVTESTIRIISARRATTHERKRYEEEG